MSVHEQVGWLSLAAAAGFGAAGWWWLVQHRPPREIILLSLDGHAVAHPIPTDGTQLPVSYLLTGPAALARVQAAPPAQAPQVAPRLVEDPPAAPQAEEEPEVPEAFLDPISLGIAHDPVVLVGTGAIYSRESLFQWLATGSRVCPKTNILLKDIEVVPLTALRQTIREWCERHGVAQPQAANAAANEAALAPLGPELQGLLASLRGGDVRLRGVAAGKINNMFIDWQRTPAILDMAEARTAAFKDMMLDLLWLLRHGDYYGAGVAAAALSQADAAMRVGEDVRHLLATLGALPAARLLHATDVYAQHSAARFLSIMRGLLGGELAAHVAGAGALSALCRQLQPGFPYVRCSAAVAIVAIMEYLPNRTELRRVGGVQALRRMVVEVYEAEDAGPTKQMHARYDCRDAAHALIAACATDEELAGQVPDSFVDHEGVLELTADMLRVFRSCGQAWIEGRVPRPGQGLDPQEEEELTSSDEEAAEAGEEAEEEEAHARADESEWETDEEGA
ncbi:hypothetical protein ACKKBG_A12435 [Auxenochlorella protothecoides x Auxenochlorella symbiontica]